MKAVAEELKTKTTITEIPKLIEAIGLYVETNLNVDDMIKLSKLGFEIDTDSIDSIQLPPMELLQMKSVNGKDVLYVEPDQIQSYVKSVFNDESKTQGD